MADRFINNYKEIMEFFSGSQVSGISLPFGGNRSIAKIVQMTIHKGPKRLKSGNITLHFKASNPEKMIKKGKKIEWDISANEFISKFSPSQIEQFLDITPPELGNFMEYLKFHLMDSTDIMKSG